MGEGRLPILEGLECRVLAVRADLAGVQGRVVVGFDAGDPDEVMMVVSGPLTGVTEQVTMGVGLVMSSPHYTSTTVATGDYNQDVTDVNAQGALPDIWWRGKNVSVDVRLSGGGTISNVRLTVERRRIE